MVGKGSGLTKLCREVFPPLVKSGMMVRVAFVPKEQVFLSGPVERKQLSFNSIQSKRDILQEQILLE